MNRPFLIKVPAKWNFMNDLSLYQMEQKHRPAGPIQLTGLWKLIHFKSLFWGDL